MIAVPLAIAAVMFAPPARGQIAVVSLFGVTQADLNARVRAAGAYPLTNNKTGGMLIAFGDDPALFFKLLPHGLIAMRPPIGCGAK